MTDMKIMGLTPCLMLDNNRAINAKSIQNNIDILKLDEYVIYDQMFQPADFNSKCTYIGHADKRMGWAVPRNALLKYFYDSDFDYAFFIDANSVPSKPTINDLLSIIRSLRDGELSFCDAIFSTLGMWVSQERIMCKSLPDHLDNVHLVPARCDKSYNWMHGLFVKNFKKYYGQEFYMDERCHVLQGTPEDVFFARLLRKYANCWIAPTVVINKPSSNASCTMANGKGTYEYPPVLFDKEDEYIAELSQKMGYHHCNRNIRPSEIVISRVPEYKDLVTPYKSRQKKVQETSRKQVLF